MRYLICIFVFTVVVSAEVEYGGFEHDGYQREYIVFTPENFEPGLPLVFNLHGDGMTAQGMLNLTEMNEVADTANFVLVYPNSADTGPTSVLWNSGITEFGDGPPDVDDVGFLSTLIDTIYDHYAIDTNRVYACGVSGGAVMVLRLAAELSERVRKVATVAGVSIPTIVQACSTANPISALFINGTEDPYYDMYESGESWFSVMESLETWAEQIQCSPPIDSLILPDVDQNDEFTVTVFSYKDGVDETEVIFYRVEEAGHMWPGMPYFFPTPPHGDINASEVIWNFFNCESYEIRGVWAHDLMINGTYQNPAVDSLTISAAIVNTDNHAYEAYAILRNMDNTLIDSFQLFDDGLHDDGEAGDGIAKTLVPALQSESNYFIQTTTLDLDDGTYLGPHDMQSFTTIGPLALASLEHLYPAQGAIPPSTAIYFDLSLENLGLVGTAENISVAIHPADTNTTLVGGRSSATFGDIPVGETTVGLSNLALRTRADLEDGTPILFNIEILSQGVIFWQDSGILLGYVGIEDESSGIPQSYDLNQNYPNPFNPTTTISYDLPAQSTVKLTVYDIRGKEVITLQDAEKSPGNYDVQWNGLDQIGKQVSTGVYFARLDAGDFTQTIKMLYLK